MNHVRCLFLTWSIGWLVGWLLYTHYLSAAKSLFIVFADREYTAM